MVDTNESTENGAPPPVVDSRFLPPVTGPDSNTTYPIVVVYCGECGMPVECCSYSHDPAKCRAWLEKELPNLAAEMKVSEEASGSSKSGRQTRGGKGVVRPGGPGEDGKVAILEIAHSPRGKKFDTVIIGFPSFGIAVKDVSRKFAQRFSCGVSVQAVPASMGGKYTGQDMLLIQADVLDKLKGFISEQWSNIPKTSIQEIANVKR